MDVGSSSHNLGVNSHGKTIKKDCSTDTSPLRPPPPQAAQARTHPRVYRVSKTDFRSFVQHVTGAVPCHPRPRPAATDRLRQVRPPPLAPLDRISPTSSSHAPAGDSRPSAGGPQTLFPVVSPVSAYMHYLESSLLYSNGSGSAEIRPGLTATGDAVLAQPPALLPSPASQCYLQLPRSFFNLSSANPSEWPSQASQQLPLEVLRGLPPSEEERSGFYSSSS